MTEEINNQEEVLEETEQEQELVEAPEQVAEEQVDEDKVEEVRLPSTKTAMIKTLFDKVNGLKKEEVSKRFKDLLDVIEAEDLGGEEPDDSKPEGDKIAIGKKKKKILGLIPGSKVIEKVINNIFSPIFIFDILCFSSLPYRPNYNYANHYSYDYNKYF